MLSRILEKIYWWSEKLGFKTYIAKATTDFFMQDFTTYTILIQLNSIQFNIMNQDKIFGTSGTNDNFMYSF